MLLLVSMQNGIGLSMACELTMMDVQEVSKYIKSNAEYRLSCINAVKIAASGNIEYMAILRNEKKFSEWNRQRDKVKTLVADLTLWEDHCKKSELDNNKTMRAVHIYKTIEECATAVGMYRKEFVNYIIENEELSTYLSQARIYNF